jgi:isopentenyl diphosphate isomerase/L-lactate dehydrogenase-like FMN-dependent dehydrogenase
LDPDFEARACRDVKALDVRAQALILGADAVLVGRPVLWGLALGGQPGVARVLGTLRDELRLNLALVGAPSLRNLNASMLLAPWEQPSARL